MDDLVLAPEGDRSAIMSIRTVRSGMLNRFFYWACCCWPNISVCLGNGGSGGAAASVLLTDDGLGTIVGGAAPHKEDVPFMTKTSARD